MVSIPMTGWIQYCLAPIEWREIGRTWRPIGSGWRAGRLDLLGPSGGERRAASGQSEQSESSAGGNCFISAGGRPAYSG